MSDGSQASVKEYVVSKGIKMTLTWSGVILVALYGAAMYGLGHKTADLNGGKSAAMRRFRCDDSVSEFYTLFRYSPVKGIGYEKGVGRRDPSTIIKVGDKYYVWYTRISGHRPVGVKRATEKLRAFRWDLAEIWYATSKDGRNWKEQGVAVTPGPKGSFDDRSVFTTNILVADGKYYLVYQAVKAPYTQRSKNVIAMSVSDSPEGP